ncbi:hypothetical protein ACOMHN_043326 [Nucella lapillus]
MLCEARKVAVNEQYYLNDENLKKQYSGTAASSKWSKLYATHSYQLGQEELHAEGIQKVFQKEVVLSTPSGAFMGSWHLHAVASILHTTIQTVRVYPEYGGHTVRHCLQRLIAPRLPSPGGDSRPQTIMWSVILPGETLHFPFVFKSEWAGVFTEQWLLETRPALCGGAALVLTLRGVALEEDKFQPQREELERELETKQSLQVVSQLLEDMVSGVRTPLRCPSPVDAYITEEEIFRRNNHGLSYRHDAVSELKQLHLQLVLEEEKDGAVWDLCVLDLKELIMELDEDDERKESLLTQLNTLTSTLTFDLPRPVHDTMHNLCHKLLAEAVDTMVTQSSLIRQTMGMSAREMGDFMDDGDSRKGALQKDRGKAEAAKDKKLAAAAAKDAKAGTTGKETPKPDPKAKAPTPSQIKKSTPTPTRPPGGGGGRGTFDILGKKMEKMDNIFQYLYKES